MTGKYQLIYADPPWRYDDKLTKGKKGVEFKYDTMSVEELCALPVPELAAENCVLAMWWTPVMVRAALRVVDAWGFELKNIKGFTWVKLTNHGNYHFGMGRWTRANTEDCMIAVRGKPIRASAGISQLVLAARREHSQKPDEVRDKLVQLVGDVPRVELFARQRHAGWDAHGNEVESPEVVL